MVGTYNYGGRRVGIMCYYIRMYLCFSCSSGHGYWSTVLRQLKRRPSFNFWYNYDIVHAKASGEIEAVITHTPHSDFDGESHANTIKGEK